MGSDHCADDSSSITSIVKIELSLTAFFVKPVYPAPDNRLRQTGSSLGVRRGSCHRGVGGRQTGSAPLMNAWR